MVAFPFFSIFICHRACAGISPVFVDFQVFMMRKSLQLLRFFICIVYVAHIYGRVISANYLRQFLCMFYFWNHTYYVTFYSKFPFHSKYACYIHCKRISHFSFLIGICIKNDTSRNYYINETKGERQRQKNP